MNAQEKTMIQKLSALGWTELQSIVYIATLKNGDAPASIIAKTAHHNRVTTYDILQKLSEKGAVSISEYKGVKHFRAIDPKIVIFHAKQKFEELENTLPLLEEMKNLQSFTPSVQVFKGLSGIKKAYMQTLTSTGEILSFANSQNIRDHWKEYDSEYVEKRAEKKIYLRGLAPNDDMGKTVHQTDKQYYREIRLLPNHLFPPKMIENEINLWDNKMMIASFDSEPFAILIDSSAVFMTQKQIFEVLWGVGGGGKD